VRFTITASTIIFIQARVGSAWSVRKRTFFSVLVTSFFFFSVGIYWLTFDEKPDETLFRVVLCPIIHSKKCTPAEIALVRTAEDADKKRLQSNPPKETPAIATNDSERLRERPLNSSNQSRESSKTAINSNSEPLSCEEYRSRSSRANQPDSVVCNSQTSSGYYWAVSEFIRPYGYWGMKGTGETPKCDSDRDIGTQAETASFNNNPKRWEVRRYWCRNTLQNRECTGANDEGPTFSGRQDWDGVFRATCRRQHQT
jgi:hypothetical protein